MGKGITKARGGLSQCGNITETCSFHQNIVIGKPHDQKTSQLLMQEIT